MRKYLLVLLLIIPFSTVFADDEVEMSVNQSVYYFTVGDNAVIPLEIDNNSGATINGLLQYTLTQQIQQGNAYISTTNSHASSFSIDKGHQIVDLDFGTSNSPSTLAVTLNFSYDDGQNMDVSLGPIEINFVPDASQQNNSQDPVQSSSQQSTQSTSSAQQQSMQNRLDSLLNSQPQQQNPQQRLQNNQLAQDSNALKQQIHEQVQHENRLRQDFEQSLAANKEFQKMHNQLVDEGYSVTGGNLDPISNSTGNFTINYENQQGHQTTVQGSMSNGIMTDLQKQEQEDKEDLLSKLRSDSRFQKYNQELIDNGYSEQGPIFEQDESISSIVIEYQNPQLQTSTITGYFEDGEITDVILDQPSNPYLYIFYISLILLAVIVAYLLSKKLRKTKPAPIISSPQHIPKVDNVSDLQRLLQEAQDDFVNGNHKEAYAKIGQALRLYLRIELGLDKEITNEELLSKIDDTKYPLNDIKKCLSESSLVEFAKQKPDEIVFNSLVATAKSILLSDKK